MTAPVYIYSSSDCSDFECNNDLKDLDLHAEEVEALMSKMNVMENPLFDEPPSSLEMRNDDPYWCRDNPLFVEDSDDISNAELEYGFKQTKEHIGELSEGISYECFTFEIGVANKYDYHDAIYLQDYEDFQFPDQLEGIL